MKTLMSALLGLSLLAAVPMFAQDTAPKAKVHKAKKAKKDKKK